MARSSRCGGLGPACGNKETGVFDRGVCGIDRMSAETTGRGRGRKDMGGGGGDSMEDRAERTGPVNAAHTY